MLKVPIAPELQDVFYKQEVQSFLESFVVPADESGKAVGGAPTSVQQVIDDVAEIWKEYGNPKERFFNRIHLELARDLKKSQKPY